MVRILKPRTHAGKQWTKARYFQFIRSALRQAFMRYPVKSQVKNANRRVVTGKRHRFEYLCAECAKWYKDKETQVDHVVPAGSLNDFTDLPGFVERLYCEPEDMQILCTDCHATKTAAERRKR